MKQPSRWTVTATRPVLVVSDIGRAVSFFETIGFREIFRNDIVYAVLRFGELDVHLGTKMEAEGAGQSMTVIEMKDVDRFHDFCVEQGVAIHRELQDRFYGLRDFQILDPDGNLVTFAQPIQKQA